MAEMTLQDLDDYISREVSRLESERYSIDARLIVMSDEIKGLDHEGNLDEYVEMEFEEEIALLQRRRQEVIRYINRLGNLHLLVQLCEGSGKDPQ